MSKPKVFIVLILFSLLCPGPLAAFAAAGGLSGTVKDPNGAAVVGAKVTATNTTTNQSSTAVTDSGGRYKFDNLVPGTYTVSVNQDGFKAFQISVEVADGKPIISDIKLEISTTKAEINVPGKTTKFANSDPNYRQLRDEEKFDSYTVSDLVLKRDVGTITLRRGTVGFLPPVLGTVAKAVFVGEGEFNLVPATQIERNHLKLETENETLTEPFSKIVFYFTDSTYQEIKSKAQPATGDAGLANAVNEFNKRVRYAEESLENIDAEILGDLYNPKRAGAFTAYINGQKHHDLRFMVRPWGAIREILTSPEEVALINLDNNNAGTGLWYMAHRESEYKNGTASSLENKHAIHTLHYKIESVIDRGANLTGTAELTFKALMDGDRVLRFGLLPRLRVSRVMFGTDTETSFIQEDRKRDGTFYVILPEPTVAGKEYKLTMEYRGNQVVEDAGGGSFYIGAREAWFPSSGVFDDRATYDLTFKVPKQYTLVSVGKLVKESQDGDYAVTQWVSDVPLVIAGFNYGKFKKKDLADPDTKYHIEGYATAEVPGYLKNFDNGMISGSNITPTSMMNTAMVDAQNSVRVFTHYFGELPYGRIAITQQPQLDFGQSWPALVYLPITAFMDSTVRWMIFQRNANSLNNFILEVTQHEVSHQWWGHVVCWASYHDQWLSEGFADFSAGLYLQLTEQKPDKYIQYWQRQQENILQKNPYGLTANDAGPIWMGIRLATKKTEGAYQRNVYGKGAYVLHMLRSIMWNAKTGDENFIAMMKDFVKTYYNQSASTESFKEIVEKHMTPAMDIDGNRKMDWFFNQWVYGTQIPHYKFTYNLTATEDGKVLLEANLTQGGVDDKFKMIVPVYAEFNGKMQRLGEALVVGNSSVPIKVKLPVRPGKVMINYYHDILSYEVK